MGDHRAATLGQGRPGSKSRGALRSISGVPGASRTALGSVSYESESTEGTQTMNVGFIGLGRMGAGMAGRLLAAGHTVTVYNRTPEKAQKLIRQGGKLASTVAQACQGDAVITMLANDAAVENLVLGPEGVTSTLRPGSVRVSSSTISVGLSNRLAEEHARH